MILTPPKKRSPSVRQVAEDVCNHLFDNGPFKIVIKAQGDKNINLYRKGELVIAKKTMVELTEHILSKIKTKTSYKKLYEED